MKLLQRVTASLETVVDHTNQYPMPFLAAVTWVRPFTHNALQSRNLNAAWTDLHAESHPSETIVRHSEICRKISHRSATKRLNSKLSAPVMSGHPCPGFKKALVRRALRCARSAGCLGNETLGDQRQGIGRWEMNRALESRASPHGAGGAQRMDQHPVANLGDPQWPGIPRRWNRRRTRTPILV